MTALTDIPLKTIDGKPATLGDYDGTVRLVVNVASKCGLTPISGQRFQRPGAGHQRRDPDFLLHAVQRHLPAV